MLLGYAPRLIGEHFGHMGVIWIVAAINIRERPLPIFTLPPL